MLAGNPLVQGTPAGRGVERLGRRLRPLRDLRHHADHRKPLRLRLAFGDHLRLHGRGALHQRDARATPTGRTPTSASSAAMSTAQGNRLTFNLAAGRQRFTLANAFLIANTAVERLGPRGAAGERALGLRPARPRARSPTTRRSCRPSTSIPTNSRSSTPTRRSRASTSKASSADGLMVGAS